MTFQRGGRGGGAEIAGGAPPTYVDLVAEALDQAQNQLIAGLDGGAAGPRARVSEPGAAAVTWSFTNRPVAVVTRSEVGSSTVTPPPAGVPVATARAAGSRRSG